ncbi:hypothetical protein ARZXY2_1440 [Arthrobacter sp. ZXY-2]|nr:hypothetical protein ARZXY2_1440 [Arthrobacter sp. ZXY-2]
MGFDWGQVFDVDEKAAGEVYDQAASDALYQDHPRQVPDMIPGSPVDPGDKKIVLPFDEV